MGKKSRQQPKPPTQPHPKHRARKKQPKQESNSDSGSRSQPPTAPGPRRRQQPSLPSSRNRAQPGPHVERPMSGSASAADLSTTMPPVVEVDGQWADGPPLAPSTVIAREEVWYDDLAVAIAAMFDSIAHPHPPNVQQVARTISDDSSRLAAKMLEYWRKYARVPLCSGAIGMSHRTLWHSLAMHPKGAGPVQYLLDAKADPDATDNLGYTALHLAARFGQAQVCAQLLAARADADLQDGVDQNTALHWAMLINPRSKAVEKVLREFGASDQIKNCRGETAARLKRRPRSRAEQGMPPVNYGRSEAQLNPLKCTLL